MIQKLDTPVSVIMVYDHKLQSVYPHRIFWQHKPYKIQKVGLHHSFREGRTLYHVFSVECKTVSFRLVLNTETLFWRVEEISDDQPN